MKVELSPAGSEALGDDLGARCDTDSLRALALSGDGDALEVAVIPSNRCQLHRFVLTPELGTFAAAEGLPLERSEPQDHGQQ